MKAVIIRTFGPADVMEIAEVGMPSPSEGEVLVRVFYSSVNPVDWKIRNGSLRIVTGSRFPMRLGQDVAGEVAGTGRGVTKFQKGDRVFGMLSLQNRGAYAQYVSAKETGFVHIPENLDFREAAAVPLAALTAYQALHYKARQRSGESVLINGASGGVGSFAVQIAKATGAKVTAVCGATNIEIVKGLGADEVMDYSKQDFTQLPGRYDIIFDAVGKLSFFRVRNKLRDSGRYVTTLPTPPNILSFVVLPVLSLFGYRKRSNFISVRPSGPDLESLALIIGLKKLVPLIDRVYDLEDISEAHVYSETGRARGKILIRIE